MMKRFALLLIGGLLVIALLKYADLQEVYRALSMVESSALIAALLLQLLTILLINLQWSAIAKLMGEKISLSRLLHINMAGTFFECITPAVKAGGEAVKVVMLRSEPGFNTARAGALVGLQKTVSMLTFLFLCILGLSWFLLAVPMETALLKTLAAGMAVLLVFSVLLLFFVCYPQGLQWLFSILPLNKELHTKISSSAETFRRSVKKVFSKRGPLVRQFLLALLIWLLFAVKAYLIARALQVEVSFIPLAVVTFLTYMVASVPLTPGGLGTFEGGMVLLLLPLGVPIYQGLALALVLRFVTFWFVFLLSALYLACQSGTKVLGFTK
ncbi:lysylphosphatidylglycerol synthase transmembrane domain-containing protein [Desulfofalx alkaliphila]|uniref:lysylphosphatidylglycerol synthase transmembrane domain-containing protein n=1 Tax=Desulfofalx alkaliphila TaxID=105483 RepID=UPI0004E0EB3A|nr:lysylphosphatidylglycerol synthase transmembrane domain-containing protein [Desulfofalx alkaliphila]